MLRFWNDIYDVVRYKIRNDINKCSSFFTTGFPRPPKKMKLALNNGKILFFRNNKTKNWVSKISINYNEHDIEIIR